MTSGSSARARCRPRVRSFGRGLAFIAAPLLVAGCAAMGVVPRFDMLVGPSVLVIGDNYAGLDNPPPASLPVPWGTMFHRGTGYEIQWVWRRPSRAARTFAKIHTSLAVRGTFESYGGSRFTFFMSNCVPDDLEILGTWLEGRTVLGTVDGACYVRPYLQYGGGVMYYSEVNVSGLPHWDATVALGGRAAGGLEFRRGRLGIYAEGGIQVVGPPDVAQAVYDIGAPGEVAARTAQDLVTYPIRLGIVVGF